jgi:hypothetical protein
MAEWLEVLIENFREIRDDQTAAARHGLDFNDSNLWIRRAAEILKIEERLKINTLSLASLIGVKVAECGKITKEKFVAEVETFIGSDGLAKATNLFHEHTGMPGSHVVIDVRGSDPETVAAKIALEINYLTDPLWNR